MFIFLFLKRRLTDGFLGSDVQEIKDIHCPRVHKSVSRENRCWVFTAPVHFYRRLTVNDQRTRINNRWLEVDRFTNRMEKKTNIRFVTRLEAKYIYIMKENSCPQKRLKVDIFFLSPKDMASRPCSPIINWHWIHQPLTNLPSRTSGESKVKEINDWTRLDGRTSCKRCIRNRFSQKCPWRCSMLNKLINQWSLLPSTLINLTSTPVHYSLGVFNLQSLTTTKCPENHKVNISWQWLERRQRH